MNMFPIIYILLGYLYFDGISAKFVTGPPGAYLSCAGPMYNGKQAYAGNHSITKDGYVCRSWKYTKYKKSRDGDHNYCRVDDSDDDGNTPWCYYKYPGHYTWNYCVVPNCASDYSDLKGVVEKLRAKYAIEVKLRAKKIYAEPPHNFSILSNDLKYLFEFDMTPQIAEGGLYICNNMNKAGYRIAVLRDIAPNKTLLEEIGRELKETFNFTGKLHVFSYDWTYLENPDKYIRCFMFYESKIELSPGDVCWEKYGTVCIFEKSTEIPKNFIIQTGHLKYHVEIDMTPRLNIESFDICRQQNIEGYVIADLTNLMYDPEIIQQIGIKLAELYRLNAKVFVHGDDHTFAKLLPEFKKQQDSDLIRSVASNDLTIYYLEREKWTLPCLMFYRSDIHYDPADCGNKYGSVCILEEIKNIPDHFFVSTDDQKYRIQMDMTLRSSLQSYLVCREQNVPGYTTADLVPLARDPTILEEIGLKLETIYGLDDKVYIHGDDHTFQQFLPEFKKLKDDNTVRRFLSHKTNYYLQEEKRKLACLMFLGSNLHYKPSDCSHRYASACILEELPNPDSMKTTYLNKNRIEVDLTPRLYSETVDVCQKRIPNGYTTFNLNSLATNTTLLKEFLEIVADNYGYKNKYYVSGNEHTLKSFLHNLKMMAKKGVRHRFIIEVPEYHLESDEWNLRCLVVYRGKLLFNSSECVLKYGTICIFTEQK